MNNKNLFQFSLTAICSVVLAACGSGGSSNPTTVAEPTIAPSTTPETTTPTITPAVTDNTQTPNPETNTSKVEDIDAQELATLVSETPFLGYKHVNKRNSGLITNTDANGSKRNHSDIPVGMNVKNPSPVMDTLVVVEPKPTGTETVHKVGYLEDLDLRAGGNNATNIPEHGKGIKGKAPSINSVANQKNGTFPFMINNSNPNGKVSTLFVGRAARENLTIKTSNGDKYYSIHVNQSNTTSDDDSEYRSYSHLVPPHLGQNNTKSDRKAIQNPSDEQYYAYHYQLNRTNYTDETFQDNQLAVPVYKTVNGKKVLDKYKYVTDNTVDYGTAVVDSTTNNDAMNLIRKSRTDLKDNSETATSLLSDRTNIPGVQGWEKTNNVAEIYGYRTFPASSNGYKVGEEVEDFKLNNLPLENKQLQYVQYGRVTTYLSDSRGFDEFRRGLDTDGVDKGIDTYVVSYGTFGKDGTEDQYFYRGINHLHGDDLKKLSANTSGTLKYWGHAVAYGLDDKWDGNPVSNSAPTAIGGNSVGRFVSGNHAYAAVDLKSGKVDGAIYNTWYNQDVADAAKKAGNNDPKAGIYPVDLVRFNGLLASNGNITGTAVYRKNGTEGLFGATLYGKDAREIGGVVSSHDKTENNKWGAVFGAVRADGIGNATNLSGQ